MKKCDTKRLKEKVKRHEKKENTIYRNLERENKKFKRGIK